MLVNLVFFFFVILSETKDLIIIMRCFTPFSMTEGRFFALRAQTVYKPSGNDERRMIRFAQTVYRPSGNDGKGLPSYIIHHT